MAFASLMQDVLGAGARYLSSEHTVQDVMYMRYVYYAKIAWVADKVT
jgi:hypothetical protein